MSLEELRGALKTEKMTFGSKEVLRKIQLGAAKKVFLAATCAPETRDAIKKYAALKNIAVVELPVPASEIALLCKKNYPIAVLSL